MSAVSANAPISLVVGLGNPGPRYEATRHNAGYWLLDELLRRHGGALRSERKFHGELGRIRVAGHELPLLRPSTYMNHSGRAVAAYAGFFRLAPASILVVHDEIDLPPGSVRLKRGGGHGGHNGLRDIAAALGTREFARLRLGVGHPGSSDLVVPYVLSAPGKAERAAIDDAIAEACEALPWLLEGEWDRAFQALHSG
ncbi:aminoacyl-tRNA hydrolase [Sediminicurvatus halobius]|uniref:Peptidyl-tRNA hydrolase n=1 Tax=Sediminicurvatus halobius TaxID=2182432 RepID=A0A2U2N8B3_9GAMM|nr:aminoacyl-tRNA hydrolase [Spiribacter halobius]PWG65219.1 aminoacyl-tRNA hydrolase [Spiribacter halobius]UEX78825.1 aminoacyl-tRNA hydrolase [Spiribacter halobius]